MACELRYLFGRLGEQMTDTNAIRMLASVVGLVAEVELLLHVAGSAVSMISPNLFFVFYLPFIT